MALTPSEKCRRWYYRHHDRVLASKRKRRKDLRRRIEAMKKRCARCGFTDPRALQFHHVRLKQSCVSKYVADGATKLAIVESRQCEIICANCHAIEHYGQRPKERQPWLKSVSVG